MEKWKVSSGVLKLSIDIKHAGYKIQQITFFFVPEYSVWLLYKLSKKEIDIKCLTLFSGKSRKKK